MKEQIKNLMTIEDIHDFENEISINREYPIQLYAERNSGVRDINGNWTYRKATKDEFISDINFVIADLRKDIPKDKRLIITNDQLIELRLKLKNSSAYSTEIVSGSKSGRGMLTTQQIILDHVLIEEVGATKKTIKLIMSFKKEVRKFFN